MKVSLKRLKAVGGGNFVSGYSLSVWQRITLSALPPDSFKSTKKMFPFVISNLSLISYFQKNIKFYQKNPHDVEGRVNWSSWVEPHSCSSNNLCRSCRLNCLSFNTWNIEQLHEHYVESIFVDFLGTIWNYWLYDFRIGDFLYQKLSAQIFRVRTDSEKNGG